MKAWHRAFAAYILPEPLCHPGYLRKKEDIKEDYVTLSTNYVCEPKRSEGACRQSTDAAVL